MTKNEAIEKVKEMLGSGEYELELDGDPEDGAYTVKATWPDGKEIYDPVNQRKVREAPCVIRYIVADDIGVITMPA